MKWITSDTHFGHYNIIKYCNRPFKSVSEMNETIIGNWNSVVKANDDVHHLGDFGFGDMDELRKVICRLNGKIHLLCGNHDRLQHGDYAQLFASVNHGIYELKINKTIPPIVLCHYPMLSWNRSFHGSIHLFGHIHSGPLNKQYYTPQPNSYDVGVDNNNFTPISLDDAIEKAKQHV